MIPNLIVDNIASWLVLGVLIASVVQIWGWFPVFWICLGQMALSILGGGCWKRELLVVADWCRHHGWKYPFGKEPERIEIEPNKVTML